jgi:hypothetical protein
VTKKFIRLSMLKIYICDSLNFFTTNITKIYRECESECKLGLMIRCNIRAAVVRSIFVCKKTPGNANFAENECIFAFKPEISITMSKVWLKLFKIIVCFIKCTFHYCRVLSKDFFSFYLKKIHQND